MSGIMNMFVATKTTIATAVDAFFNSVSLLLNTTATNGAQNNTFLDSSTNNFSITRNGNTTQGTFTPFSQTGWGNYFDSNSSYLNFGNQTALHLGSGNFTVEMWVWKNANTAYMTTCGDYATSTTNAFQILADSTGEKIAWFEGTTNSFLLTSTASIPVNAWTHIAFVRSSTTLTLYINGTSDSTASLSTNYNTTTSFFIGHTPELIGGRYFNGYISNFRMVKGTAVYTSAFTPSTTPLTAITNTSLLTCQSNRFLDNSSNAFALTVNGTPSVQAFSPFLPTTAYDTAVVGGSGYFDGSGDNLTWSGTALGSGDYTVECSFYATAYATYTTIIGASSGGTNAFALYVNSATQVQVDHINVGNVTFAVSSMSLNSWNHLAVTRSSNNLTVFVNGVRSSTGVVSNSSNYSNNSVSIGYSAGATYFPGYISNLRIVTGSAVYNPSSSTITVPTAPLTAITNTQLLTNFTNAGIYDSAAKNVLETVGNAQVSTTQAKWGTTSMYFDGTGDYLVAPPSPNYSFGTGNFTIEGWFYLTGYNGGAAIYSGISSYPDSSALMFYINASGAYSINVGSSDIVSTGTAPLNTWVYFALVRSSTGSNGLTLYINGTSIATVTSATSFTSTNAVIGRTGVSTNSNLMLGYLADLRVTKYARYTANFTAPTAAFPLQ